MKSRVTLLAFLLVLALSLGAQASINFIVNGGFETGDYTGWTSGGCGPAGVIGSGAGWLPNSGNYFSVEGAVGCDHTLSQTFSDIASQGLTISFYYGSDGASWNDINVYWNGNLIYGSFNDPSTLPNYLLYTFNVTATGSDTLTIGIRNDPAYQALDDVSVTASTPEPGTLVLMGSGLLGLAGVVRRKFGV